MRTVNSERHVSSLIAYIVLSTRFFNHGDASPKWGHEMISGGRELDSTIIFFHKFLFCELLKLIY